MTRTRIERLVMLLLCLGLSSWWAANIRDGAHGAIRDIDFASVYYQAQCGIQGEDPYDAKTVLDKFQADGQRFPASNPKEEGDAQLVVPTAVYPPTTLLTIAPLALLPWTVAQAIWLGLMDGLLALAAFLMWDLAGEAQGIAGALAIFMMLNCVWVQVDGNPAGIVIPLCVAAGWCLLKERFWVASVMLLAVSLAMKPQVAGFIWLFFLLSGGIARKRAWQALALVAALGICSAIWMATVSPHWTQELAAHLRMEQSRGSGADPGPAGIPERSFTPIICLQNTLSVFLDEPRFYNPISYAICGGLILVWIAAVLRKRTSQEGARLALAAISILTLLPVYHMTHDTKLLLLTIPACAMLWAGGGARRWVALGLTWAAIFVTSDIPLIYWTVGWSRVAVSTSTLSGKLKLLALQPAPLVLLATGCFYLWAYIRYQPPEESRVEEERLAAASAN